MCRTGSAHARPAASAARGRGWYRCGRPLADYTASVTVDFLAFFQLIVCAAIGANGAAGTHDFNVDARMHAPEGSMGAGAIDGEIAGPDEDGFALRLIGRGHDVFGRTAHFVS